MAKYVPWRRSRVFAVLNLHPVSAAPAPQTLPLSPLMSLSFLCLYLIRQSDSNMGPIVYV